MRRIALALVACLSAFPVLADSLFHEEDYQSLVGDRRAYRVGDNLTVLIVENSSATTTAGTTANKTGALDGHISDVNGVQASAGIGLSEDFNGGGKIQRSGKLLAQITVQVIAVDDLGNLQIKGEQRIKMNDEEQNISLEGRVRPQDVAANNTVVSTRLSDAHISYVGDGVLGEKQRPGILWRFLSWLRII